MILIPLNLAKDLTSDSEVQSDIRRDRLQTRAAEPNVAERYRKQMLSAQHPERNSSFVRMQV